MIKSSLRVGFTVGSLEKALAFYTSVLPFKLAGEAVEVYGKPYEDLQALGGLRMRVATLRLGHETLELTEYLSPAGRPIPPDSRSNDSWFQHIAIVVSDMAAAYAHLSLHNVRHVSVAPQTLPKWNKAAADIQAFYFQDPDGHNLEIIYFPLGKGDPRWQEQPDLFLGIDHTAIAVNNTSASLKFYRDTLGMRLVGESLNYGLEQEQLNGIPGSKVRICGLRSGSGFGVEFLEYLQPRTGRPFPADTQANDLWHWQTTLEVDDPTKTAALLQAAGYARLSSEVVTLPDEKLGFQRGFMLRDPDGHALRLIARIA
jgi:catechol 2,3-dioxygenase-like lactoylglutathione lyase family enzyme